MPQSNITFDSPYNRSLVSHLEHSRDKHFAVAGSAYAPTPMGFKMSQFHNDYTGEPVKVGGGSPFPQKFLLSGNSPAYPPHSLSSGLAVSSGGAYMSSVDGAIGGYSFNDFMGDVAHVGREVAPDIIRGLGRKRKAKGGSKVGDQIASAFKSIAPFAPLLLGLGHPAPKKKADVVKALAHIGAKPSHSLPKLADIAMKGGYSFNDFIGDVAHIAPSIMKGLGKKKGSAKGGYSFNDFIGDVAHVGKEVAPDIIRGLTKGAGKKAKKAKGGFSLSDVLESAKPAISMAVEKAKPVAKRLAKKAVDEGAKMLKDKIGGAGGRAKRAAIVKKIMAEKGLKMIDASRYVKQHNLY